MTVRPADYCKQLIADLDRCGVTLYKLFIIMNQAGLKTHYRQLQRWANGTEPKARHARLIEDLHAQMVR